MNNFIELKKLKNLLEGNGKESDIDSNKLLEELKKILGENNPYGESLKAPKDVCECCGK
jgi:hypothetical protein